MSLPGFGSTLLGFLGGSSGVTLSFVTYATQNGNSGRMNIPASAAAGDVAMLFDAGWDYSGSSIGAVTPTDWTNFANTFASAGGNSIRMMVSRKRLVSGDAGKQITGINTTRESKIMLIFRPNRPIVSEVASTWNAEITASNPTSQTVTASGQPGPLIVGAFAVVTTGSSIPFSTETPSMTNVLLVNGSGGAIRVGYTLYNSSPANQSIDIDDLGVQGLQSGYLRFT